MHLVDDDPRGHAADQPSHPDAASEREMQREADAHARMLETVLLDIDDLDPVACPPDRRFLLGEREAWVYDHGKIVDLVYVKVG